MSEGSHTDISLQPRELIAIKIKSHKRWIESRSEARNEGQRFVWSSLSDGEKDFFLGSVDFSRFPLFEVGYQKADFKQTKMPRARFSKCDLSEASFREAFFPFSIFSNNDLKQTSFTVTPEIFTVVFSNNTNTDKVNFFNAEGLKLKGIGINSKTGRLEKRSIHLDEIPSIKEGFAALCDFDALLIEAFKRYPKEMTFLGYTHPEKRQMKEVKPAP